MNMLNLHPKFTLIFTLQQKGLVVQKHDANPASLCKSPLFRGGVSGNKRLFQIDVFVLSPKFLFRVKKSLNTLEEFLKVCKFVNLKTIDGFCIT